MGIETHPSSNPGGPDRDLHDFERLQDVRQGKSQFPAGRYLQAAPMLFTRDGHNVFLGDMYRGHTAFLICAGPSLLNHDLADLNKRGILTLAVNNAAVVHRPQLWCSVDDPGHFCDAIWYDPGILKFVPLADMENPVLVRDENGLLVPSQHFVGDMPAVFGFRRNEAFVAEQWLYEDSFNWGNHGTRSDDFGNKGSRSVMYVAMRLLFYLGVRRVYLLGCDFRMEVGKQNYAFPQDRSSGSVRGNNRSYQVLNLRLAALKPYFDKEGFEVYNCTRNSGLMVFPHVPFEEAICAATAIMPKKTITEGMYDGKHRAASQASLPDDSRARLESPDSTGWGSPGLARDTTEHIRAPQARHARPLQLGSGDLQFEAPVSSAEPGRERAQRAEDLARAQPRTDNGVIYYLWRDAHAARLLVSILSLRRWYDGPVAVVFSGPQAGPIGEMMTKDPRLGITHPISREHCSRANTTDYLFKTELPAFSPFESTLYLDSDTLIRGDLSPLFDFPSERHVVVTQFCNWRTDRGIVRNRINSWTDTHPDLVERAHAFGQAINTGVVAFTRQSAIFERWARVIEEGRHHFIPDELALQLLLPHYPHVVLDGRFNCSPKHGEPEASDTRIVHFHGNKHVGTHQVDLWMRAFEQAREQNVGRICDWAPAGDAKLADYLRNLGRSSLTYPQRKGGLSSCQQPR